MILHISDLHFSSNPKIKKEKEKIVNSLLDVLIQLEPEWKPNVICVSGDIVDRYDVSAYSLVKIWFEKLSQALDISMDSFILTPGNHDCSCDIKKYQESAQMNDLKKRDGFLITIGCCLYIHLKV